MLTIGLLPNPIKTLFYKITGMKLGKNVSLGLGTVIVADEVDIEEGVSIGFGSYLRAKKVKIGRFAKIGSASFLDAETISIGEDAKISEQVFVGGLSSPESFFKLGARTILMQHTFINVARPVTIGDDTGIGGRCTIFTHGSWQNMLDGYPVSFAPVTIGNNVWIPWQVFIMPGVNIGDGATIGAGSLVTKNVPAGALAVGSPAKVLRSSDEYPARLEANQKIELLRQIITEFTDYLKHAGLKANNDQQSGQDKVTVIDEAGQSHVFIVSYNGNCDSLDPSSINVLLSLIRISPQQRLAIENSNQMWLDIYSKERGGTSSFMNEELVEFIKRYGVRFERVN